MSVTDQDRIDDEEFTVWWRDNEVEVIMEAVKYPPHRNDQAIARIAWKAARNPLVRIAGRAAQGGYGG
jgi:hypothetical protein